MGILQVRILERVAIPVQRIFLTQGWNLYLLRLLYWQVGSLLPYHLGSPLLVLLPLEHDWPLRKFMFAQLFQIPN